MTCQNVNSFPHLKTNYNDGFVAMTGADTPSSVSSFTEHIFWILDGGRNCSSISRGSVNNSLQWWTRCFGIIHSAWQYSYTVVRLNLILYLLRNTKLIYYFKKILFINFFSIWSKLYIFFIWTVPRFPSVNTCVVCAADLTLRLPRRNSTSYLRNYSRWVKLADFVLNHNVLNSGFSKLVFHKK